MRQLRSHLPLRAVVFIGLTLAAAASASAGQTPSSASPTSLVITQGGTYSGTWSSNDPKTPAVTIETDQPVTLRNASLSGRGDLIEIYGNLGANVTIENVTGTAMDPGVSGLQRGAFVLASKVNSLQVTHCSMSGVSFGMKLVYSLAQSLVLSENKADDLEDRASDGKGGLLSARPTLGHFINLIGVVAPNGADISWNEVRGTIGTGSTEDVINIYKSQGTASAPIHVHDNYLEGYSSVTTPSYTGTGIIADGDGKAPDTAYTLIENNEIVHVAGSGIEIATGHDNAVRTNRLVSCGQDASGNWFAMPFANAVVVWNYYGSATFFDNSVEGTVGGFLRPSSAGAPQVADLWVRTSDVNFTDNLGHNSFTDPCLVHGQVNLNAEAAERGVWASKLASAGVSPGATN